MEALFKSPNEVIDFTINYTYALANADTLAEIAPIVTVANVISPTPTGDVPPVLGAVSVNPTLNTVKQRISGGSGGNSYKIACRVTTTGGQQLESVFKLKVKFGYSRAVVTGQDGAELTAFAGVQYPGMILQHASVGVPDGWAVCDGAALNQSAYPDLFNVIGVRYGDNGAGTFRLPALAGSRPFGAVVGSIQAGDIFTAHLPGVDASYTAISGDGINQIAAGLCAAITSSPGYSAQPFTVTVNAEIITLTASTPGIGFTISLSTATAPLYATVTANVPPVAQIDTITITGAVDAGDAYIAHLPGVDASYTATTNVNTYGVATGLCAAIVASAGYAAQPFAATAYQDVVTLTAKTPGTGFTVTTSATNGGADNTQAATVAILVANIVAVAQVDTITIDPVRCAPWPPVAKIIKL